MAGSSGRHPKPPGHSTTSICCNGLTTSTETLSNCNQSLQNLLPSLIHKSRWYSADTNRRRSFRIHSVSQANEALVAAGESCVSKASSSSSVSTEMDNTSTVQRSDRKRRRQSSVDRDSKQTSLHLSCGTGSHNRPPSGSRHKQVERRKIKLSSGAMLHGQQQHRGHNNDPQPYDADLIGNMT